jgi:hypothetical protein
MFFSLDVRRARKGDCLLLHVGSKKEPGLVMIDGGPKSVYGPHLKPRIEEIRKARGLGDDDPLEVALLMVSHVDDDHIQGILDLTSELKDAQREGQPQLIQVLSFWHNSFDEIIGHEPKELTASVKTHFGPASVSGGGEMPEKAKEEVEEKYAEDNPDDDPELGREVVSSTLKVLASIEQGFRLRQDAEGLDFPRNPEFDGKLIVAREDGEAVDIAEGLKFTVVGPMQPELQALHEKHQQWLDELKKKGKSPPAAEALAAYVDKSVPNLSSIVVLAEAGGKRMLLTGDARGDKVLEGLELVGLIKEEGGKMHVDLLKVPHHGSSNNLDDDFFERITADHYVFSGDGEHGNPERESLEMLLNARGDADYTVHLTYPVPEIDEGRKEDWDKERNKQVARKKKNPKTKVRENWSPAKHSLTALLADNPKFAKKIKIVDATKPHVIDLLNPVGF